MPPAFPGQIPPDRRFTDHDKEPEQAMPNAGNGQGVPSTVQNMWLPPEAHHTSTISSSESIQHDQTCQDPKNRLGLGGMGSNPASRTSPLLVRPLSELTSNACRMVEAATGTWRYSPYDPRTSPRSMISGHSGLNDKSFIKTERMSPKLRAASVSIIQF